MSKDFWESYVPEPDKRQQALDRMAENARELGLDYEPAQQEPVIWAISYDGKTPYAIWPDGDGALLDLEIKRQGGTASKMPLYTSPPAQRTWVGLTEPERLACYDLNPARFASAIEAKLKEKNT